MTFLDDKESEEDVEKDKEEKEQIKGINICIK